MSLQTTFGGLVIDDVAVYWTVPVHKSTKLLGLYGDCSDQALQL